MIYNLDTLTSILAVIIAADQKIVPEEVLYVESLLTSFNLTKKEIADFRGLLKAKLPLAIAARGDDKELPLSYFSLVEVLICNIKKIHSLKEYTELINIISLAAKSDNMITNDELLVLQLVKDKCH